MRNCQAERDNLIRRRAEAGESPETLAAEYQITARRVYQIIGRKAPRPRLSDQHRTLVRKLRAAGVPQREIAKQLGIARTTVQRLMEAEGLVEKSGEEFDPLALRPDEEALIRDYWKAGRTVASMSQVLGRSTSTIWQAIKRMGLPRRDGRL